jgi:ABC-type Fe3+-hydroxamate transport system substrate-binding protein
VRNRVRIAVAALLAIAGGVAYSQAPKPAPPAPGTSAPAPPELIPPSGVPVVPVAPAAPQEKTIDQILDDLERVRLQKAELEKKEQELIKEARRRLEKQADRANRLGVVPVPPEPPVPTTVPAPSSVPAFPAPAGGAGATPPRPN